MTLGFPELETPKIRLKHQSKSETASKQATFPSASKLPFQDLHFVFSY